MKTSELLLLPADELPYGSLDANVLLELATQREEPFIATSALGELAVRREATTIDAANRILRAPWDHHLTAFALELLFDRDPSAAIDAMKRLIGDDPVLLASMVEAVLLEPDRFANERELISALHGRVASIPEREFSDPQQRALFLATYD